MQMRQGTCLVLDISHSFIVPVRRAVQFEDYPISHVVKEIVDQRNGHQKKDDENPSVVDDDILQAPVLVPGVG